jgi:glutamine amidotransferase
MIAIVDYGLGNVQAIANIYKRLNVPCSFAKTPEHIESARKIILPGVGAFDYAMSLLRDSGMEEALRAYAAQEKGDVLGICVGMQILAEGSAEGVQPGFGWIKGRVERIPQLGDEKKVVLPHMGWNDVETKTGEPLFKGISTPEFYFLHSYFLAAADTEDVIARTHYGSTLVCGVRHGLISGVQFHPEKSHMWGVQLLKNFAEK